MGICSDGCGWTGGLSALGGLGGDVETLSTIPVMLLYVHSSL